VIDIASLRGPDVIELCLLALFVIAASIGVFLRYQMKLLFLSLTAPRKKIALNNTSASHNPSRTSPPR
jgi:hypothetical protein